MLDRILLGLILQDFDSQTVRRLDIGLVQPVVAAREHRHACGLPLGDGLLDILHDEPDVVDDAPDSTCGGWRSRLPRIQIDNDARKYHALNPWTRWGGAAHADEDLP